MNKYQEALDVIVDRYEYLYINKLHESGNHIDDLEEYWTLNELVEKSKPKKPIVVSNEFDMLSFECPNCHKKTYTNMIRKYCGDCGQKLDWGDQE